MYSVKHALNKMREVSLDTVYEGRLYIVGGYVRDKLMNLPLPDDVDIVLEGDALALADFFYRKGICDHKPVIFPRFGTAMTHISGCQIEFVTARAESYHPDSRKPEAVQPATLLEDARRRDFTVNTLLENLNTEEIVDPLDMAMKDLKSRLLRTPLNPVITFRDDPLRMLRAIRFSVRLGFDIEPKCAEAIRQEASRLKIISFERIRDEFLKIVGDPNGAQGLELLLNTGLLSHFAPELVQLKGAEQNNWHVFDVWDHTMAALKAVNPTADVLTRLALLFHDVGKPHAKSADENGNIHFYNHETFSAEITGRVLRRLKFPSDDIQKVVRMVGLHMRVGAYENAWSESAVRRLYREVGDLLPNMIHLCRADTEARRADTPKPDFDSLESRIEAIRKTMDMASAVSPLSGAEIMELLNLTPGREVGFYKEALTQAVIDGNLQPDDKDSAIAMLNALSKPPRLDTP